MTLSAGISADFMQFTTERKQISPFNSHASYKRNSFLSIADIKVDSKEDALEKTAKGLKELNLVISREAHLNMPQSIMMCWDISLNRHQAGRTSNIWLSTFLSS